MKGLEDRLSQIEQIADRAMAQDEYPVPQGKDTLVQSMGRELKARVQDIRELIAEGGKADIAACWMYDAQELRAELLFTMADPDAAARVGMGSLYRSDEAVARSAAGGRKSRSGASKGGGKSKRRVWAERAAARVNSWEDLPLPGSPWEFEDLLVSVYRDGDHLCAADIDGLGDAPATLARSTFEKRYLKK